MVRAGATLTFIAAIARPMLAGAARRDVGQRAESERRDGSPTSGATAGSARSGVTRKLTKESFAQAPTFTPGGKSIVYVTGAGADIFPSSCKAPTGGS